MVTGDPVGEACRRILSPVLLPGVNSGASDDDAPGSLLQFSWMEPYFIGGDGESPAVLLTCHADSTDIQLLQFVTCGRDRQIQVLPACYFQQGTVQDRIPFEVDGTAFLLLTHQSCGNHPSIEHHVFSVGVMSDDGLLVDASPTEVFVEDPCESLAFVAPKDFNIDETRLYLDVRDGTLRYEFCMWKEDPDHDLCRVEGDFKLRPRSSRGPDRFDVGTWKVHWPDANR